MWKVKKPFIKDRWRDRHGAKVWAIVRTAGYVGLIMLAGYGFVDLFGVQSQDWTGINKARTELCQQKLKESKDTIQAYRELHGEDVEAMDNFYGKVGE